MRERILNRLYEQIDKDPLNLRLRKQVVLLNKASICTIDSFCLEILKNNFFEIDVSSNFRIADSIELELLKQEALEDIFEELYLKNDKDFEELIKLYASYKDDEKLKEIILKIHNFIQSAPFPREWLEEKIKIFNPEKTGNFSQTIWGKIILNNFKDEIENAMQILKDCKIHLDQIAELSKYSIIIEDDIRIITELKNSLDNWDLAYEFANTLKFKTWPTDKKIVNNLKDEIKSIRDNVKKRLNTAISQTFLYNTKEAIDDCRQMYSILEKIKEVTIKFEEKFEEKKSTKNVMDFSDIEHKALEILLKKDEKGVYQKTEVAKKYEKRFEEIAIDEYQDSNLVQEYILTSISNNKNIFMVGDVKQSIYRFRQAKPELFLEKYEKYCEMPDEKGQKIKLFKNFRSRKNILDVTNIVFQNIMSREFGEIEYNESEYLYLGANYEEPVDQIKYAGNAEIDIINLAEETFTEEREEEQTEILEKTEIEAKYVAKRIKTLIDSKFKVYDKNFGYRDIKYKDIVILLRATTGVANIFEKELSNLNIPVFSDQADNYLESIEIKTMIALLKIIDNPYRDIALVTVMRSMIGDFTDNELIEIRLAKNDGSYYECIKEAINSDNVKQETKEKLKIFLEKLEKWRKEEKYYHLDEFIQKLYDQTDYYNYVRLMPNGKIRKANLRMLLDKAKDYEKISFKGLFNFIRYIEKVKNSNSDMQSAKVIGENEDVVRIMSIHKSKGLEFPVAIISQTNKKFNQRDLTESILMHQELGFGMQYINYDRKIEYTTASKEAVKIKIREESIAEEMRILYVGLTRAKEKLIITGVENDLEKSINQKEELIKIYEKENGKINHLLLKKFQSYLEWLELVYLGNDNIEKYITLNKIDKKEVLDGDTQEEKEENIFEESEEERIKKINDILNWEYKYKEIVNLQSKMSVTKIKELKQTNPISEKHAEIKPKFMIDQTIINATQKGTIIHLILQKLDFKKEYTKEDVIKFIESMCYKNQITENEKKAINIEKIYKILKSEFFSKIRDAKEIKKESPFYTYVNTKDVYDITESENILVQGIIDLYYIDKNDRLILVDYKTDYTEDGEDLVEKYKVQLDLYKKALEESLNRRVDEIYIYSIYLNKPILYNLC